uniref:Carbamoyl-phosphate synthase L chain, ATP binding domain n=1 Tax=Candidatus Kentrum sp. TC TaxID=2126339 RepID=A0A450YI16_9GAMM|nr:MAG: Carbamoyl-phosphate synthase L chain, ATP binding domain [Candidatus Kentron sp. TC]VFK41208.1 MAG: Carbamoyl-phosphate synthase L chain, ATP binding domain [Candidatus Kentron sp. TC]
MKKLLLLNGSHSDIPLILSGKELGYHVITTGNIPELIGHEYADEYHLADFSDCDAILRLAERLKIDAVCSCANDFGAITAAYVAEAMGLPGHDPHEIALTIHHKDRFKRFSSENALTTPMARGYATPDSALADGAHFSFPLLVKPIDLTGGKGISKVESSEYLSEAIHKAFSVSRARRIIVEEFIEGSLHSFSAFIVDGRIVFYFCDNEFSYLNPFLVSTSAAPAIGIDRVVDQLISQLERLVSQLSLVNGVLHAQYILEGNTAWIIEITRRCSGDFYPNPVTASCGLDWAEWIVKAEIGADCADFPEVEQRGYYGRHCIMSNADGIVEDILIDERIRPNIHGSFMMWKPGRRVSDFMVDKLGIVFLRYGSMDEMLEKTSNLNRLIRVGLRRN